MNILIMDGQGGRLGSLLVEAIRQRFPQVYLSAVGTNAMAAAEAVKARIAEAAKYVPLVQLCLSPQCGFSSTEEGNIMTEEEQWAKVRLVVEIAREPACTHVRDTDRGIEMLEDAE